MTRSRGFTMIELMVAMVVSAIVVLGIYAFSTVQQATATIHQRNVRVQQSLEGAMWSVSRDMQLAGMGFARMCTEVRIYDPNGGGRLINPGGAADPSAAVVDAVTGEPYWVLRDGVQAHFDSSTATSLVGTNLPTSADPTAASDSFDILVADAAYTESAGVFQLAAPMTATDTALTVQTGPLLDNGTHLADVRQMFPPGSFVLVTRTPTGVVPMQPEVQGQCMLLQVTGEVMEGGGGSQQWSIPIGTNSGFNAGLGTLLNDNNGAPTGDDWDPALDAAGTAWVVPVGHLRWSRYEIDYTVPRLPYLVRYDLIGFQQGVDPVAGATASYPGCEPTQCPMPQLHLPGSGNPPLAVAVGPLIEDMQVAVGCDGYTVGAAGNQAAAGGAMPPPDTSYAEVGPAGGIPNRQVDENPPDQAGAAGRAEDEWLGNAVDTWAPDCVYYGTGEYNAAGWGLVDPDPGRFRMSPQTLRVTLLGSSEAVEEAGGIASNVLPPLEDRPAMTSPVGVRQRFSLTEIFTPPNLRWRDPMVL